MRLRYWHAAEVLACGWVPLNPAVLPDGLTEREYMLITSAMLHCADVVILLEGWRESAGARAEYALAQKMGIHTWYYPEGAYGI